MAKSVLIVYTNCSDPTRDAEFNQWYNTIHIPDVLCVSGFTACTRYKLTEQPQDGEAAYLAIYEIDSDDPDAAMAGL
ncbi:MAG: hypothetical protein HY677_05590, partial [Chloroflexi bacterium]|nr:hypothetical protein [Chloroflexota bacterium]